MMKLTYGGAGRAAPVRTLMYVAAALLLVLAAVPPHGFDAALARIIFSAYGNGWESGWFWAVAVHKYTKIVTGAVCIAALAVAFWAYRKEDRELSADALRVAAGILLSLVAVVLLKEVSGVYCPRNVSGFGGSHDILDPFTAFLTSGDLSGRCWPAGHANTGFCLLTLALVIYRRSRTAGLWVLVTVLIYGNTCATGRMLQGAHFASHGMATLFLDFCIACLLTGFVKKPSAEANTVRPAFAVWTAAVLLALLSMPFYARVLGIGRPEAVLQTAGWAAFIASVLCLLLLPFVKSGKEKLWRGFFLVLALIAACADDFTVLYGTVITPSMMRNAVATDVREATELLSLRYAVTAFVLWLPALVFAFVCPPVKQKNGFKSAFLTLLSVLVVMIAAFAVVMSQMNSVAAFIRSQKDARYLIQPVMAIYSASRTLVKDRKPGSGTRAVIDEAPHLQRGSDRPLLIVTVVARRPAEPTGGSQATGGTRRRNSQSAT